MKKSLLMLIVTVPLLLIALQGCGKGNESGEIKYVKGAFGHLESLNKFQPTNMYLIHLDRGYAYNVCLAEYMTQDYPGIQQEIEAAINLWAHYIGREIPVVTKVLDLPRPSSSENHDDLVDKYYRDCGDVELVVGESYFKGTTVGITNTSYSYYHEENNKIKVALFKRGLFLKKPSVDNIRDINWISFEQASGKKRTAEEIVELMKNRNVRVYTNGPNQRITLKTILHEVGHIWGLCDQYETEVDNCDPNHSIAKNHESIMSNSEWISKIYLTDDDIEGIRKFGEREEFLHSWPRKEEFGQIEVPNVWKRDLEYFRFRDVSYGESSSVIDYSLVTNKPYTIQFFLYDTNTERWMPYSVKEKETAEIFSSTMTLQHSPERKMNNVKVVIKIKASSPEATDKEYTYIFNH